MNDNSFYLSSVAAAIHSKNLVAIVYLLVALAMHFQAPIRLPEHVSVQVVVVKVKVLTVCCDVTDVEVLWSSFRASLSLCLIFLCDLQYEQV